MARIRTIKPEFFIHSELYDAEVESGFPLRIAFAGLWCQCDREGRFKWRPRELKLQVLPYDKCDFSHVLDALTTRGFLVKYAVKGELFGAIPSWDKHQVINNRESESVLPDASLNEPLNAKTTRDTRDDHAGKEEGKGREGKGTGKELNPSRAKTPRDEPTKSDLIKTRHAEFKEKIKQYWEYKNPGVEMPWGPAEGRQLAMWLAEAPQTNVEQFTEFLRNRARSEVNHAERPSRWIGNITSYANGPLNTFKQPINGAKSNGGKTNGHVVEGNGENLKAALASLDWENHGEIDGDFLLPSSADQPGLPEVYVGTLIEGKS